jgi:hypothetical protein
VERTLAASTARNVGFVVPFTEAGCTLSYNLKRLDVSLFIPQKQRIKQLILHFRKYFKLETNK